MSTRAILSLLCLLAVSRAFAQNGDARVDTRVGGELYGNNSDRIRQLPYQVDLLPSEERYAMWRSGALPSELRLARTAAGPLIPNGVLNYIPARSPLQEAYRMKAPQLYNPAYRRSVEGWKGVDPGPNAKPGPSNPEDAPGADRDDTQTPPHRMDGGKALPTGQLPSGLVDASVKPIPPVNPEAIYPDTWTNRNVTFTNKKPATQPTTQPAKPYQDPEEK